jgi:hypothetical protein
MSGEHDMKTMGTTWSEIEDLMTSLSRLKEVFPRALVKRVYDGPSEESPSDIKRLRPGQVLVNTKGEWVARSAGSRDEPAWVVIPYGSRPQTEEDQFSGNRTEHPLNQFFGFYGMPRIGDTVFMIGMARGEEPMATEFFVLGTVYTADVNKPPLADSEDLMMVHRSGASLRLNDTYGGGGVVTADEDEEGPLRGLTGNLTLIGNRLMVLSGSKYLPHGLLAKYGDPRERFSSVAIDIFDGSTGGHLYSEVFDNDPAENTFYDPFVDETMSGKVFLRPPSADDDIIPLTDNTMLIAHHGGGVFRIDDHNAEEGYSRMTMSAASMTTLIGKDFRPLGLMGDSSAPNSDTSGIDENADEYAVYQIAGARFRINAYGDVDVFAAPGRDIIINSSDGNGKVYLGEGIKEVIRHDDSTTTNKAYESPGLHISPFFGIPHAHVHEGHAHKSVKSQETTYV